ncbi:ribosome maturation factor RimM [Neptunicoccus sediminis]|uniref:ribosome maturation factor RimM n=1 Tax=Neptunicoccus sediminis TaxID=1892596 RepID=UPI0009F2D6DF|nr:ribosome maturation factor RimM [Neptunicoccus sediminis]
MAKNDTICVAAIMGAFGVKGEVRIKSFCAQPEDVGSYGLLSTEDGSQTFDLTVTRPVKGGFAARIKGVRFKDEADALRGVRLFVPRSALPNLPDDEYYYSDLIGMEVVDTGGEMLGKVRAVHDHGAGDILEVRLTSGGDALLPFTREIVPTVDMTSGRIVVDPPEGAIDGG